MTVTSNNPIWWPLINSYHILSYSDVACFTVVMYDWGK
ncbi:hypothetical protein AZE42_09556 [Rhizopogon vesiculosus]|uniref:Uncharacterized protein n=1 Tax=Rhizopogon vesiculosus TaxID=180088 RepID=A0A1J8R7J7_9AGAM|nr:hypothetical protein AZE42_09556 [Rhizopogon vesiculosus]